MAGAAGQSDSGAPDRLPAKSHVQSVDRAVDLLRAVAAAAGGPNATVAALAAACGLNRSTAWRMLSTLEARDFVVGDRRSGRYAISVGVLELARAAGDDALVGYAHATLERLSLQTGEWAALAIYDGRQLVCVDEVRPPVDQVGTWLGQPMHHVHALSCGKAFLAFSPPETVEPLLGPELERFTDTTITDRSALESEFEQIRKQGFAVCRGEFIENEWGVAAPVLGAGRRPLAVIALWGPGDRGGQSRFTALGELAREAAQRLSFR
ncbi:IclR family transcriptional regulator [Nocardioides sp.]|uniref:IclR family transcriptional regulator n=1 Tax=Nocardioides sp. TaxID=35761 RepID=UPI003D0FF72C